MFHSVQKLLKAWKNRIKRWKMQEKFYQSPIQIILDQWDNNHPPTQSQTKEILKHQKVQIMRDYKGTNTRTKKTWLDQNDIL